MVRKEFVFLALGQGLEIFVCFSELQEGKHPWVTEKMDKRMIKKKKYEEDP